MNSIINILKYPSDCTNYPTIILEEEFKLLFDILRRNRLTSYLAHYQTCPKCRNKITSGMHSELIALFSEIKFRSLNYLLIKRKLEQFIRKNKLRIFILKDYEIDGIKGYPAFYIPLKYDLDILGAKKELAIIRDVILKLGYHDQRKKYGYPFLSISQYKFKPIKTNGYFPQIEYRLSAITIPHNHKIDIISQKNINDFTRELLDSSVRKRNKIFMPLPEYKFIQLCLIYYMEDLCKGLNNLYRIYLFQKTYCRKLDWARINEISTKYRIENLFKSVLFLAESVFGSNKEKLNKKNNREFRFLRRIFSNDYISRAFFSTKSFDKKFAEDSYAHFISFGIVAQIPFPQKIIFFLHPRRFFTLLKYALTA